ncbi:hypothetical protein AtubIFM54640_006643 [Aspergillus tubingensis]|nr:hypothetical protein AtubIFM54640_006643 [Aspergillus tubingensis]
MDYETKHDDGDKTYSGLHPSMSVEEGQVDHGETTNDGLHRTLSPRMIHTKVISLGSSIGSGLFITTGKSLAQGGPANMFLAYLVVCVGVWANLQTLTEMTIAFPTSGNYIDYADRWVDPALAFGAGFAEWLGWTSVFASEAMFVVTLVNYWADGVVPEAALLTIFLVLCLGVFLLPTIIFGWLEYIGSLVKMFLFIFVTAISLAVIAADGTEVLNWFISITSASFFTNWAIIAFSSFRFRAAIKAQRSQLFEPSYAWRSLYWPLAPVISLFVSALLLVCLLYTSIKPVGGGAFTAYNFFSATIGLIVIMVFTIGYKIVHKTPWRDPATADLITGHRELTAAELRFLDAYYERPLWAWRSIERATLSELIQIDKNYLTRITLRTKLIQDKRASVLGASPHSIPAVKELYSFLMNDYLPRRYNTIFQRISTTTSTSSAAAASASAPTTMLRNTVTGETIPTTPPTDAEEALAIIGRQVEEDFLLLLPPQPSSLRDDDKKEGTNKQMTLEAFIGCFPNGFNWADKFRKSLASIHVPVPDYTTKLRASMDRYLERLKVGECVKRANWTVSVDGELHAASSMHLYEGEEVVELEELDVDTDVKKEGNGPRLVEAIAGLKEGSSPGFHFYKRAAVWQRAVIKNPSHITSLFATTAWFNILSALDHLLLNPKEADDFVAIREGTSKVKSFFNGLRTALKQHLNSRKINTPEEAKNTPPIPGYYTHGNGKNASKRISRHRYLIRETAIAMWQYLVLDISTSQAVKTGLSKNEQQQQQQQQNTSVQGSWVELCIEQIIVAVAAWFIVGRIVISFTYRLVAVVSVGLRFEAPEEYPPLFSKMADAYTLRNFWGKFWHQLLRIKFTAISNYITRDILGLAKSSFLERYTHVFCVFLLSGILHLTADVGT